MNLTQQEINKLFKGKRVMITGGTGSFGHFIVNELLKYNLKEITILSRDEEKQLDMSRKYSDSRLNFIIGNVRDLDRLLKCVHSDYLFHAAALKIITTCEKFPVEGIKTNLLGTLNVREACLKNNVEKALLISTDKAVKPVNAYGMTKALAEKVWLSQPFSEACIFSVLRYGNVIGSRGSVVPFFKILIQEEKPLPITHPSMSRFIITLKQAINLAFYTIKNMMGGEIFVPKNSASKITALAEALAGKDYPTYIVGIRSGEKISESLISEDEIRRAEDRGEYYVIHPFGHYQSNDDANVEFTSETTTQLNIEEIRHLLEETKI